MKEAAKFRVVLGVGRLYVRECLKCRFQWLPLASGPDCPICSSLARAKAARLARLDSPSETGRDRIGAEARP